MADIDVHLETYVEKSYSKLKEKQKQYNLPDSYCEEQIRKEVHDALQTFLYQVNSCVSCSGQTPFISISFGTSTTKFGRMIQEEYLKVHTDGLGIEHKTPVFPKVIFILDDGINMKEGDINYDIKQLALICSSKRIYPDFISGKLNKKVTGSTTTVVSPMGKHNTAHVKSL